MNSFDVIMGVPQEGFLLICLFYSIVFWLIFDLDGLEAGGWLFIVFFTFGTTYLIGRFGWLILVVPALIIIVAVIIFLARDR